MSEAIEGCGGSSNAATDRESTVYWARAAGARGRARLQRPVRAGRPAAAARRRHRARARHHRRGDPLLPRRPRPVRLQPVRPRLLRRHAARLGDRRRRGVSVRGLPDDGHPRLLVVDLSARQPRSSPSPATSTTTRCVDLVSRNFGTGNGVVPGVRRRADASRRAAQRRDIATSPRRTSASACPALRRDHPDQWTLELMNTRPRRGFVAADSSSRCERKPAWPTTSTASRPTTPTAARSRSTPASTPTT